MEVRDQHFYYDLETAIQHPENVLRLDLHYQQLNNVPKEIAQLTNLKELYLWNNSISDLPDFLFELPNLRKIDLSGNNISIIPTSITK